MNIIIAGCSRLGAHIATTLDHQGHKIQIIDRRPSAFNRLESGFTGNALLGTAIDEDILESAGIASCDVFIAVTESDNTNLMSAQIALKVFHVPQVASRTYDPIRAEIFAKMGIITISPTIEIGIGLLNRLELSEGGVG